MDNKKIMLENILVGKTLIIDNMEFTDIELVGDKIE